MLGPGASPRQLPPLKSLLHSPMEGDGHLPGCGLDLTCSAPLSALGFSSCWLWLPVLLGGGVKSLSEKPL